MATAIHEATRDVAPSEVPRNGALSGRDLLARIPTEDVETPIGTVTVRGLGVLEMLEFGPRARQEEATPEDTLRLMVDVTAIGLDISTAEAGSLPVPVIIPVFGAIMRLSGFDRDAVDEATAELKDIPNGES